MPLDKNSYNLKLYNLLKTRGYRPIPLDSKGERSEAPQEADVFKFTFSKDDEKVGTMYATVEEGDIVLYYDEDEVSKSGDANTSGTEFTDSWIGLVRHLKHWAMTRQLGFRTEPDDKLASDMAQREYMKKKENISEGYYPMGKSASYNDAIPTVKIILQHTRQIQEGEQRFRHVNKIFLENSLGERILAPTIRPGLAQVYARHIAEGGVPNDERWNHLKSLCEEYSKMAGFVRAVRNNQFNESAQQLVNEGVNHYQGLRETLGRMRGHRGYNTYFESWTPTLMEDESSDNTLNELFVQETLDPRIESVLPILSKLRKTVGEMKEVNELAEWAEELTEAPGSETLAHNEKTEKQRLDAFDLEESDDAVKAGQTARDKIKKPAFMRKAAGEKPATLGDVERSQQHRSSQAMVGQKGQEVEESGLQAYLGNKKYGKDGMDALRKAGRDGASKEKMASIRAKYDKLDEEGMEEGWNDRLDDPDRYEEYLERLRDLADYNRKRDIEDPPQKHKAPTDDSKKQADESVDDMFSLSGELPSDDKIDKVDGQDKSFDEKMKANTIKHLLQKNPSLNQKELEGKSAAELISMLREGVEEGDIDEGLADNLKKAAAAGILGLGLAAGGTQAVKDYNTSQDVRQTQQQAPTVKIGSKNFKVFSQDLASKGEYFARKVGSALKDKIIVTDGSGNQFYLGVSSNNGHNYRLLPTSQTNVNSPTATVGNKQMTVISPTDYEKGFGQKAVLDKMLVKDNSGNSYYLQVTSNTGHNMWLVPVKNVKEGVEEGLGNKKVTIQGLKNWIAKAQAEGYEVEEVMKGEMWRAVNPKTGGLKGTFHTTDTPGRGSLWGSGPDGTPANSGTLVIKQGVAEGSEQTNESLDRLLYLANIKTSKKKVDESIKSIDKSIDKMFSLGGELPSNDTIDKVDGQDMSFDEEIRANTINHLLLKNPSLSQDELKELIKGIKGKSNAELISMLREGVAEGSEDYQEIFQMNTKQGKVGAVVQYKDKSFGFIYGTKLSPTKFARAREAEQALNAYHNKQGVAEDLDANQKRVGQLGPTEKVKNNNIGKLVGANESVELSEMDKSQPSSDRGGESSGNPYAKGGKATPVKAKEAEKDAEKALNKSMDKAHKKDVKEGQEDLDAILRIIRK